MFSLPRPGTERLLMAVSLALLSPSTIAAPSLELRFPSRSSHASVSQWVGLTNITVAYESPAVGGRKVWGSVAAPGALWLIGDREAPTVSFSRQVVVAGFRVAAGTYALLVVPSAADWTVVLNRSTRIWRPSERDAALDVARFKVHVETAPYRERLAFGFSDFSDQRATLDLEWEKVRVRIPIELETDAQVKSQLQSLDGVWRRYADAAWYALESGTDLRAGLRYVDQSIALRETWYNTWIKASLLAAVGDYRQAREEADRALRIGRTAGDEFTLERQIQEALRSWPTVATATELNPGPPRRGRPDSERRVAEAPFQAPETVIVGGDTLPDPPLAERTVDAAGRRATKSPSERAFGPLIKRGLPDLRRCYQRALRQDPSLVAAKLTLSIAVGPSGRVTNVIVDPPPATGTLDDCLKTTVGRWTFPASPTEYETQVPLVLRGRT
jgi:Protein of unknown function (DUF2911)